MKNDNRILGSTGSVIDPNSSDDWKGYFSMYNTQKKEMTYEEAASTFGTGVNTFASAVPQVVSRPGHDQTANAQKMMFTQSRIVAEMERYNQMWASRMANTEEEETEFLMEVTDVDNIEMVDDPLGENAGEGVEVSESGDIVPEAPNVELTENSVIETSGELVDMDFGYDLPNNIEYATGDVCVPVDVPVSDIEMSVDIEIDDNSENTGVDGQIEDSVVVESESLESVFGLSDESVTAEETKPAEAKKTASVVTPAKKVGRPKKTEIASAGVKKPAAKKTPAKKPAAKAKAKKPTAKSTAKKTTATSAKKSTAAKK